MLSPILRNCLGFVILGAYWVTLVPGGAIANSPQSQTPSKTSSTVTVRFQPRGEGQPQSTVGGASRGSAYRCLQDQAVADPSVRLLVPQGNTGLTLSAQPTLLAYVGETSAQKIFFSLRDSNEKQYYQATLPVDRTQSIVKLQLPPTGPQLEVGKSYQWSVALICGETLRPDSPRVEGWIQRITPPPSLSQALEGKSLLEQASLYAAQGIWYDTLAALIALQQQQPHDPALATNWAALLESANLQAIASVPLDTLDKP